MAWGLERPSAEQLEQYRRDGSLARRIAMAQSFGNHRLAPHLAARLAPSDTEGKSATERRGLPSIGRQNVLAVLIAFNDYPEDTDAATVDDQLFGDGFPSDFPKDSLRNFYRRSSYGLLEIAGTTLGWYTTPYSRSQVEQSTQGREALIREALLHFDAQGHDFQQYDNDGDGAIDYLIVIWTGPHQGWAEFWWGYQTRYLNSAFTVDGVRLDTYSWQWENYDYPGPFSPDVVIHETGHALGLPDYYDYDDAVGPSGGVGDLDQMDGNWGDHNCYSKWVLGWLQPQAFNQDTHQLLLGASGEVPEAAVLMHGNPRQDPWGEYFMVQFRRRAENDVNYPTDGLLVWHVDATLGPGGYPLYDNSYTEHKLLRLMEADGLEEIERNQRADAGDFYTPGDAFGPETFPSSDRYDGSPTNLSLDTITEGGQSMGARAALGSGCALFCEAELPRTGWPRTPIPLEAATSLENCSGDPVGSWQIGQHTIPSESGAGVTLGPGLHPWSYVGELGDASCSRSGEITVCAGEPCHQWQSEASMQAARALHLATVLDDGRVLVAGGGGPLEIFDPGSGTWRTGADLTGGFDSAVGAVLDDGRVLIIGSSDGNPVNTELYDPDTDTCSVPGQMAHDRIYHSSVELPDGRVLVAGGFNPATGEYVLETEIYDPGSGSWSDSGDLPEAMELPGLTVLGDGRVLLTGNQVWATFDPSSDTWSEPSSLAFGRIYHVSVPLPDGRAMLIGGADTVYITIFDPAVDRERFAGRLGEFRILPTATLLDSGAVLIAGGMTTSYGSLRSAEILQPGSDDSRLVADMSEPRLAHTATVLPNGEVLIAGGVVWDEGGGYLPSTGTERFGRPIAAPMEPAGRRAP
jgi:M6 family metalloprotease-like protein